MFQLTGADAQRSAWRTQPSNVARRRLVSHAYDQDGELISTVVVCHFPAIALAASDIVNVTGAGDTLVGSVLAGLLTDPDAFLSPAGLEKLVMNGQRAAVETLGSQFAVSPTLGGTS